MFIGPVSVAPNKTLAELSGVKLVILNNDPHFAYETFEKCSFSFEFKPPAHMAYSPEGKAKILTTGIH
jgi:hypothetical protein